MGLCRFGRLVERVRIGRRRPFATSSSFSSSLSSAAGGDEMIVRGTDSKSLNLYSAINQALHIALETDPQK
ncbi:hypothetical protein ACFX11_034654 [Malus domestica]